MDAIAEVHDESELDRALKLDCRLIGINNRDLKTFATTLETTERLAPRVPHDRIVIAESGIATHADLQRLAKAGVHAFLVGESLMRQPDVTAATRALLGARVMGCGFATVADANPPPPCGEGLGVGGLPTIDALRIPPLPNPSPTRGEGKRGADRADPMTKLSHLNDKGEARMVDVSDKAAPSARRAPRASSPWRPRRWRWSRRARPRRATCSPPPASPASWPPRRRTS